MFTGRDALFSIEQAIRQARADERGLDAALRSAIEEAARLRHQEAEGFRALARARLDAMTRENIIGELDATERQALALLERRQRELEELTRRRDEAQAALDRAEAIKDERDQNLAKALEALEDQREMTAERVKSDPNWLAARAAVEAAEKIAANAEQKAALAESDLAEKRRPYESDPLFLYLWNKKHGTPEDRSGFFVRFFDRKVARLVRYADARANYAMLREIPARLREHASNKQEEVEAAKAKVAMIERQALIADGIELFEARVEAAQAAAEAAEDELARIAAQLEKIEAERRNVIESEDEAGYGRAVDLIAKALAREDLRDLYEEAVRTPGKADDQAIASISKARSAVEKVDGEIRQIRGEIREKARRRSELEAARDRAREQGYDDPRGTFGGGPDILGQVIGGILAGVLQGAALDHVLRDSFRGPRRRADPDFGRWKGAPWSGPSRDGWRPSGKGGWRTGGRF